MSNGSLVIKEAGEGNTDFENSNAFQDQTPGSSSFSSQIFPEISRIEEQQKFMEMDKAIVIRTVSTSTIQISTYLNLIVPKSNGSKRLGFVFITSNLDFSSYGSSFHNPNISS